MHPDTSTKTLVIPTYTISKHLEELALRCAASHRNQVQQIIITEDGGRYSEKLRMMADLYLYNRDNVGFTKNLNRGWKLVDTDFAILANSDTTLLSGNLLDICKPASVCCPEVENLSHYPGFMGHYFVVPRTIRDDYGLLDERLVNFESDMEYYDRIQHLFEKDPRVVIHHEQHQTLQAMKMDITHAAQMDAKRHHDLRVSDYPERLAWY